MSDKLQPVNCRCGGEAKVTNTILTAWMVLCEKCYISVWGHRTEAEAIETWNRAMSGKDINVLSKERIAKVVHSTTFGDWKNMCGHCFESGKKIGLFGEQKYCYECGYKMDWSEDAKNFMEFCHTSTERFLQDWLDINIEYDEWKKEFPNRTIREFLDMKFPKKED